MPRRAACAVAALLALAACTSEEPAGPSADAAPSTTPGSISPSPSPSASAPREAAEPEADLPPVRDRISLPALMREEPSGGDLRRVREQPVDAPYRRFEVRYDAAGATVSGVLLVPRGRGPFPAVVLNHGYIEPSIYVTGQGLAREQDRLAREGFAVLHTDYRGHAGSDPAGALERESRLGYTRDAVGAVLALRELRRVDPEQVAMLGRSMGGAVTYNVLVAHPGLIDAAVVYAPVSSHFVDNYERWTVPGRPDAARLLVDRFGPPARAPRAWAALSARTYADRITEPLLIHHGTLDDSCPIAWSRATQRAFTRAGVDSRLLVYEGEQHAFGPQWNLSMRRTVRFLRTRLGQA
ncbi:MAG: alpha/beta fold hydrolase [Nocardioides sp.]|nr:alpha/beta fold hydrolase [Nocardioides sp.]